MRRTRTSKMARMENLVVLTTECLAYDRFDHRDKAPTCNYMEFSGP